MKIRLLGAALASLFVMASAQAEIFDPGYSFTYYFTTLSSYQTTATIPERGLFLSPDYTPLTATIKWEIFDSLSSAAPVYSGIWTPGNIGWAPLYDQTWLDGEGSFRITILSGSQLIQGYDIYLVQPDPVGPTSTVYYASIPVPEPGTLALFGAGLGGLVILCRRWHIA